MKPELAYKITESALHIEPNFDLIGLEKHLGNSEETRTNFQKNRNSTHDQVRDSRAKSKPVSKLKNPISNAE